MSRDCDETVTEIHVVELECSALVRSLPGIATGIAAAVSAVAPLPVGVALFLFGVGAAMVAIALLLPGGIPALKDSQNRARATELAFAMASSNPDAGNVAVGLLNAACNATGAPERLGMPPDRQPPDGPSGSP
ncbi:hypothetical protein AB0D38_14180 [Streptomyces sp. NPDC048279]|uniref:hypothetical protein n=1 Tax=Streptomyces sp. NPDC048279 TaxID=3154714 RepID=UPI0034448F72